MASGLRRSIEETGTKRMADGMATGLYNQRDVDSRARGGDAERGLSAKYQGWSKQVALETPFTSPLLGQIARMYDFDAEWQDTDANLRERPSVT